MASTSPFGEVVEGILDESHVIACPRLSGVS
jgi:hypothetical protein